MTYTLRSDPLFQKILLIAGLILTLQIPTCAISGLIEERSRSRNQAMVELSQLSGGVQKIEGPLLIVPYSRVDTSRGLTEELSFTAVIPPRSVSLSTEATVENRSRGIFTFPTYKSRIHGEGSILSAKIREAARSGDTLHWERAQLWIGVSDPFRLFEETKVSWNGADIPVEAGTENLASKKGIFARVPITKHQVETEQLFSFDIALGGSQGLRFVPYGKNTEVTVRSNWPDPSFTNNLPLARNVSRDGFDAHWKSSNLHITSGVCADVSCGFDQHSAVGVDFMSGIDGHRMSQRAIKYELLVVFLTFATFFLLEVFGKLRLHAIQYFLVGAALLLFYLLLLSLSEHIGFDSSYLIASGLIIGLVSFYGLSVARVSSVRWAVPILLSSVYGYLYTVLNAQDYALLLGAFGLTGLLAATMYATRSVNWYTLGAQLSSAEEESPKNGEL